MDTTGYWRVVVGEMLGDARRRSVQITTPVRRVGGGVFLGAVGNFSRIIAQRGKLNSIQDAKKYDCNNFSRTRYAEIKILTQRLR